MALDPLFSPSTISPLSPEADTTSKCIRLSQDLNITVTNLADATAFIYIGGINEDASVNNGIPVVADETKVIQNTTGGGFIHYVTEADSTSLEISAPLLDIMYARPILKAGTASAGSAPLIMPLSVLNTIAEGGAIEYDGTNLYFTTSEGLRQTIAVAEEEE